MQTSDQASPLDAAAPQAAKKLSAAEREDALVERIVQQVIERLEARGVLKTAPVPLVTDVIAREFGMP